MALMEVQELSGPALDWAVAKCEGYIEDYYSWLHEATVNDSTDVRTFDDTYCCYVASKVGTHIEVPE